MKETWMKILVISICLIMITLVGLAGVSIEEKKQRGTYHAVARAKVVLQCIDQDGQAVSNATINSGFSLDGNPETTVQINGTTDKDGCFVVEGRSNGELSYSCEKDGFYGTWEVKQLSDFPEMFVTNDRWQPYGMTNTLVLKRKVNPVVMYVKREGDRIALPKQDEWVGFDLERADWTSPHGTGKREDFQVFFKLETADELWLSFKYALTLRFPKPFDGFYRVKKDAGGSALRSVYEADTNRVYDSEITFTAERKKDAEQNRTVENNHFLKDAEYLVLRIRSETDKDGRLVKANYAKLYAPLFAARYGFLVTTYFNPNVNDPNLEADTTKNLRSPRQLGFVP
jgi:hypothetical protein